MTVWEFRKLVRQGRRYLCKGRCPLGIAAGVSFNPLPNTAEKQLGLAWGYSFGVIGGFDGNVPPTTLPDSEEFDRGERYGRRMRLVAAQLSVRP